MFPILGCSFVDRVRRILAIALLFCAAGAEVPRQVLIRAHNLALSPHAAATQQSAPSSNVDSDSPGHAVQTAASVPADGGENYWYFKAAADNTAVVSRRDRVIVSLYDSWAGSLCCAASDNRGSDGSAASSRSNCHSTGSAVVVGCRVIPLRI